MGFDMGILQVLIVTLKKITILQFTLKQCGNLHLEKEVLNLLCI